MQKTPNKPSCYKNDSLISKNSNNKNSKLAQITYLNNKNNLKNLKLENGNSNYNNKTIFNDNFETLKPLLLDNCYSTQIPNSAQTTLIKFAKNFF